jgi:Predicted nucleic acid-binding protein, contains PIN domain
VAEAYLVDTSVFVRWYVDQVGFEHAREVQKRFLDGAVGLETVDFVRVELAEVLRKKGYLEQRLTRQECLEAARDLDDLGVVVHPTSVATLQLAIALTVDRSLRTYDALLVAHAINRALPVLTADARLCRAVVGVVPTVLLDGIGRP